MKKMKMMTNVDNDCYQVGYVGVGYKEACEYRYFELCCASPDF